jgi:hypothetical protein
MLKTEFMPAIVLAFLGIAVIWIGLKIQMKNLVEFLFIATRGGRGKLDRCISEEVVL